MRRVQLGFTLAELLVVLVVLGLAAGLAYARLDADPRQVVEREGRRLAAALEHAASLAQWRNETLGVSTGGGAYRFWRRDTSAGADLWVPLAGDEVLAPHAFPASIAAWPLAFAGQGVAADVILPFGASGRNEPYVMEIASPEWRVLLLADPLNRVTLSAPSPR